MIDYMIFFCIMISKLDTQSLSFRPNKNILIIFQLIKISHFALWGLKLNVCINLKGKNKF